MKHILAAILLAFAAFLILPAAMPAGAADAPAAFSSSFGAQLKDAGKDTAYEVYEQIVRHYVTDGAEGSAEISFSTPYSYSVSFNSNGTAADTSANAAAEENAASEVSGMTSAALEAALLDYPEIYYAGSWNYTFSTLYDTDAGSAEVTGLMLTPPSQDSQSGRDDFLANVSSAVSEITASLGGASDRFTKVLGIHDYVCGKLAFSTDESIPQIHTAAALFAGSGRAASDGYAKAFKLLCESFDIPCALTEGSEAGAYRMWANVQMDDGKWYLVDAALDDTLSEGKVLHRFLLAGSGTAAEGGLSLTDSFTAGGSFTYALPALSSSSFPKPAPSFTLQPEDLHTPSYKKTLKPSLSCAGIDLKYRWQYQWPSGKVWKNFISGNGKSSIRVYMRDKSYDGIRVRCIVTDGDGRTITSRTATLHVAPVPVISAQPKDQICLSYRKAVTVSVKASGNGLSYRWQYQWRSSDTWKDFIYGNGRSSIRCTMYNSSYEGLRIRCVITDVAGQSIISRSAVMHFELAPAITVQPSNMKSPLPGKALTVSLKASGTGLSYRWQYQWKKSGVWTNFVSGNGKASIKCGMYTSSYNGIKVRCIVTDRRGRSVTSRAAVLTFG